MDLVYLGLFTALAVATALLISLCARLRPNAKERA